MTVLYEPLRQQAQHLAMLVGGDVHTAVSLDEVSTLINNDREALRTGVREVADINDPAAVLAACARSQNLSRQMRIGPGRTTEADDGPAPDGRVITVFAAKGGCGKTTLATNLAISLE